MTSEVLGITSHGFFHLAQVRGATSAHGGGTMGDMASDLRRVLPPGVSVIEYLRDQPNGTDMVKPAQYAVWHGESELFVDVMEALGFRLGHDVAVWCCLLGDAPSHRLDQAVVTWQSWAQPCCTKCINAVKTMRTLKSEDKMLHVDVAINTAGKGQFWEDVWTPGKFLQGLLDHDDESKLANLPATQGHVSEGMNRLVKRLAETESDDAARATWHYVLGVYKFQRGQWSEAHDDFRRAMDQPVEEWGHLSWQLHVMLASVQVAQAVDPIRVNSAPFHPAIETCPLEVQYVILTMNQVAQLLVRKNHHAAGLRIGVLALAWQVEMVGYTEFTLPLLQWVVDRLVYHSQLDQVADYLAASLHPSDDSQAVDAARSICASHHDTLAFIQEFEGILGNAPASFGELWHENNGTCEHCRYFARGVRLVDLKKPGDVQWRCQACLRKGAYSAMNKGATIPIRPPARYSRECVLEKAARPERYDQHRYKADFATYQRYCEDNHIPTLERMAERGILGVKLAAFSHIMDSHGGRAAFEDLSIEQVRRGFIAPATLSIGLSWVDQLNQDESTRHLVGVANVFVSHNPSDKFLDVVDALRDYSGRHALSSDTAFWIRSFSSNSTSQPSMELSWKEVQAAIRSSGTFLSVWTSWQQPSAICNTRCVVETWLAAKAQVAMQLCVSDAQAKAFRVLLEDTPFCRLTPSSPTRPFQVLPDVKSLESATRQLDKDEVAWLQSWWIKSWDSLDGAVQASAGELVLNWIGGTWSALDHETQLVRLYATVSLVGHDETTLPQLHELESQVPPGTAIVWRCLFGVASRMSGCEDSLWEQTFLRGLALAKATLGETDVEVLDAEHALGLLHVNADQTQAALQVLASCYSKKKESLGPKDVSTLMTAEKVGRLQIFDQGLGAVDFLFQVFCDFRAVLPDNHIILDDLRMVLGPVFGLQARYDRAHPLALEAYTYQVQLTPEMNNDKTYERLNLLVTSLLRQGQVDQAEKHLVKWCTVTGRHEDVQLYWALLHWGTGQLDRAQAILEQEIQANRGPDDAHFLYYELLLRRGHLSAVHVVWEVKNLFKEHTSFGETWPYTCQSCYKQVVGTRVTCTECPVLAVTYCQDCFEHNRRSGGCCRHENSLESLLPPARFLQERHLDCLATASKAGEYNALYDEYERYSRDHGVTLPPRVAISPTPDAAEISNLKASIQNMAGQTSVGLTLGYFKRFIEMYGGREKFKKLTTRQVSKTFLWSMTKESKLSLVEHVLRHDPEADKYVKRASLFVSHSWDYLFLDVVDALDHYMHANGFDDDTAVWFCTFCNNQHLVNSAAPLPFEFWVSKFKGALEAIGNVVMVFDRWNRPGTLERSWCVFEVWSSVLFNASFDVAMTKAERAAFSNEADAALSFSRAVEELKCENSTTTVAQDQQDIFRVIENEIGFPTLNKTVAGVLRRWVDGTIERRIDNTTGNHQADWAVQKALMQGEDGDNENAMASFDAVPLEFVRSNIDYLDRMALQKFRLNSPRQEWERDILDAIELCTRTHGADAETTLNRKSMLAGWYFSIQAFDGAITHFNDVLIARKRTLGSYHPDTLITQWNLANMYFYKDKKDPRGLPVLLECHHMMKMSATPLDMTMMLLGGLVQVLMEDDSYLDTAEELGWSYQLWLAHQQPSNGPVTPRQWIEWLLQHNRSLAGSFTDPNDVATAQRIAFKVAGIYYGRGEHHNAMVVCAQLIGTSTAAFHRKVFTFLAVLHADQHQYNLAQERLEQALAFENAESDDAVLMLLFHVMVKNDQFNTLDKIDAFEALCIEHDYTPHEGWHGMTCSTCKEEIIGNLIVCEDCPFDVASYCSSCGPPKGPEGALSCSHMRQSLAILKAPGTYLRQKRLQLLQVAGAANEYAKVEHEYQEYCEMFGIPQNFVARAEYIYAVQEVPDDPEAVKTEDETTPDDVGVAKERALSSFCAGDHANAEKYATRVVSAMTVDKSAFAWLGHTFQDRGQLEQALAAFEKGKQVNPADVDCIRGIDEVNASMQAAKTIRQDDMFTRLAQGHSATRDQSESAALVYMVKSFEARPTQFDPRLDASTPVFNFLQSHRDSVARGPASEPHLVQGPCQLPVVWTISILTDKAISPTELDVRGLKCRIGVVTSTTAECSFDDTHCVTVPVESNVVALVLPFVRASRVWLDVLAALEADKLDVLRVKRFAVPAADLIESTVNALETIHGATTALPCETLLRDYYSRLTHGAVSEQDLEEPVNQGWLEFGQSPDTIDRVTKILDIIAQLQPDETRAIVGGLVRSAGPGGRNWKCHGHASSSPVSPHTISPAASDLPPRHSE